mgnify:CR=1 FL=1
MLHVPQDFAAGGTQVMDLAHAGAFHLNPEDMTPEEQTQRIIDLLAMGCVRIAQKRKQSCQSEVSRPLDSENSLYPSVPERQGQP